MLFLVDYIWKRQGWGFSARTRRPGRRRRMAGMSSVVVLLAPTQRLEELRASDCETWDGCRTELPEHT